MGFERLSGSDRQTMARRLKAARYTAGMTVRGVAADLDVHVASVTQWETGTVPMSETRARLADLYDVDETVLFAEIEARRRSAADLLGRSA